jgi:uncharacterized protein
MVRQAHHEVNPLQTLRLILSLSKDGTKNSKHFLVAPALAQTVDPNLWPRHPHLKRCPDRPSLAGLFRRLVAFRRIGSIRREGAMSISALLKDPEALEKDLQDFASSKEAFEGGMAGLSYANGVMTAAIAGPEPVAEIEWLPLIMTASDTTLDGDDARLLAGMLLYDYGNIIKSLKSRTKPYKPFFWKDEEGRLITSDWADGFFAGIRLRQAAWEQVRQNEAREFFALLAALLQDEKIDAKMAEIGVDPKEIFEDALEAIPDWVQALYRNREEKLLAYRRLEEKVGRNDPCPCGSGKKYKKCCLN